jgi:hypothetical protein
MSYAIGAEPSPAWTRSVSLPFPLHPQKPLL